MNGRRVGILLVVAVAVIGAGIWLSSKRSVNRAPTTGQPVLEGLKPALNEVTEIQLSKGDGTKATLRKREKDWLVVEREYPADSGKVRKLLLDLGALSVMEEKTSDPANYALLGVEDVNSAAATGTQVHLVTPAKPFGLIVGKPGGMKAVYVRPSDGRQSLLASPPLTVEADAKRWLDHTVADIPESRIKEVVITPESGPVYTVTRENTEQTDFTVPNLPRGRALSSAGAANAVAGDLAAFALDDVRKAPEGAADPSPTKAQRAVFRTFDGLEVEVEGQKEGDQHWVTLTPRSSARETMEEAQRIDERVKGRQFEIPAYRYDALFRPLEELLEEPAGKKPAGGSLPMSGPQS